MIDHLRGTLLRKDPAHIVVDTGGVGYGLHISLKTWEKLPEAGEEVSLHAYLHVKEGILELYGFQSLLEKNVFLQLISVSGIGPKVALRILSGMNPEDLVQQVVQGEVLALTRLKGIGKKTAEVMVATLKSPLSKLGLDAIAGAQDASPLDDQTRDAINALVTLGVKEANAQKAVEGARKSLKDKPETGELIAAALQLV